MMNKGLTNIIIITVVLLLFSGCATAPKQGDTKKKAAASPAISDNLFLMPGDASRVIIAVSAKILNTGKAPKNVAFQSTFSSSLSFPRLFNLQRAVLLQYDQQIRKLQADLFFADSLGRTCAYTIDVAYTINNENNILVQNYNIVPKYMPARTVACFVFPADEFKKLTQKTLPRSFYAMYKYAAKRAVTPQKALEYDEKKEWALMVFVLERMPESADLELELSSKKSESATGYDDFSRYIIYNGWRVGLLMGKFHLLQPNSYDPLYAKAFYYPQGKSKSAFSRSAKKMLGLYKLR